MVDDYRSDWLVVSEGSNPSPFSPRPGTIPGLVTMPIELLAWFSEGLAATLREHRVVVVVDDDGVQRELTYDEASGIVLITLQTGADA